MTMKRRPQSYERANLTLVVNVYLDKCLDKCIHNYKYIRNTTNIYYKYAPFTLHDKDIFNLKTKMSLLAYIPYKLDGYA